MSRRSDLPSPLPERPFSVAEARKLAVTDGRLRAADLTAPHWGVRTMGNARPGNDVERTVSLCREYLPRLRPGQFFSHSTAARLWGCPLPPGLGDTLHISSLPPSRAPRGRTVTGHQYGNRTSPASLRYGLPVSSPIASWLALAAMLPVDELVAAGDHLVLDPYQLDPSDLRPYSTIEQLRSALATFHGHGARAAASALPKIRVGAESRPESLLRLLLGRAGLPEPALNAEVRDVTGRWLARCDLVYPLYRTIVEYDGAGHLTNTRQYEKDITRIENLTAADFRVIRVRRYGLFDAPAETITRVERALRAGGWQCH